MLVALIPNHSSSCRLVSALQWSVSPAFNEWLCCLSLQPALSRCFGADHLLIWQAPKHSPFGSQDPHFGWKPNHSPLSLDSQNYFRGTYMQWGNALPSPTETEMWEQVLSWLRTTAPFRTWNRAFPLGESRTLSHREGLGQTWDDLSLLGAGVFEKNQGTRIITFGPESTAN